MSLILDALNRSDSDRSGVDAGPGLHSVHGPGSRNEAPAWRRWLWPALTLVFALVAGLAWWRGDEAPAPRPAALAAPEAEPEQQPASDARPEAPVATRPAQQPRETPSSNRAAPATQRPAPGFSDDVAALYTQMQAAGVDPNELVPPPAREEQPAAVSSAPAQAPPGAMAQMEQMAQMAELSKAARAAAPTRSSVAEQRAQPTEREARSAAASRSAAEDYEEAEPAYDVDALALAAQAEMDSRQRGPEPLVQHEAPFITDLRQSQKDEIPSIFYSQHNWSSNASERSVVLNGQERREGQQVKPGLRLVEILEQSIVLNFNGTEFQLRSLNSWVNL